VFRATGITAISRLAAPLENAQAIAAHESLRTTKLYDRTGDEITLERSSGSRSETRLEGQFPAFPKAGKNRSRAPKALGDRRGSGPARRLVVLRIADVRAPGGALALFADFRQRRPRQLLVWRRPALRG